MEADARQRSPGWFVPVGALLVLWGLAGCASLYMHVASGPDMDPNATAQDRAYFASLPAWFNPVYAAAVGGGLLGAIALLLRSRFARPIFIMSLAAVIVQFGYVFVATDLLARKGAAATVPFPLFIGVVAVWQIWLAEHARRRGWIS